MHGRCHRLIYLLFVVFVVGSYPKLCALPLVVVVIVAAAAPLTDSTRLACSTFWF